MKIKILSNSKRSLSFILILAMLFILTAGIVPTIGVAALPTHKNGTMTSARTVYCLPSSQGNGMSIGSVSSGEAVKVYWQEGTDYYIEYTVSSGSYSGYKRGYVPVSSVSVSGVGSIGYTSFSSKVTSTQTVYNRSNTSSLQIGSVYASDTFTILQEDALWYYIQYPLDGGGYKRGYIEREDIIQPRGAIKEVSFSRIVGYAYDPINPNATIQAHVYIKNNTTGVQYGHALIANVADVEIEDGNGNTVSGSHGFELNINWNDYPKGDYTIELYAIRGVNPKVDTETYNTQNYRFSRYYYTARTNWSVPVEAIVSTHVNATQANYNRYGLMNFYSDTSDPLTVVSAMKTHTVVSMLGHGSPGEMYFNTINGNSYTLYANNPPDNIGANDAVIIPDSGVDNMAANELFNADIVAFLGCSGAARPAGTGDISLAQAAYDRGADVVIGFTNTVTMSQIWYEYFSDRITQGDSVREAFVVACNRLSTNNQLNEAQRTQTVNSVRVATRYPEAVYNLMLNGGN